MTAADPWAEPPDYRPATQQEKEAFHEEMQRRCADPAIDLDDWPIPYTLTPEGEAAASAEDPQADPDYHPRFAPALTPEAAAAIADDAYGRPPGTSLRLLGEALSPDPEIAFEEAAAVLDEWDSADSSAYVDRVEAGLEPEAEL
jgi:hypothetical protein